MAPWKSIFCMNLIPCINKAYDDNMTRNLLVFCKTGCWEEGGRNCRFDCVIILLSQTFYVFFICHAPQLET